MIEHLLRLSLLGELRRGKQYDPKLRTISGHTARRLLDAGLAHVTHSQRRPVGGPPVQWIGISDLGRRRLAFHLERKL